MFEHYEKVIAVVLVVLCALVGVIGYSYSKTSIQPNKVWMESPAGDVIFDHTYHAGFTECAACHHNYEEEKASEIDMSCRGCHYYGEARESESEDSTHKRFIGFQCVECHKSQEMAVDCDSCHSPQGTAYKRSALEMIPLPDKVTFKADAGDVLFDHKLHIGEDVGESCNSCHHDLEAGKGADQMKQAKSCRACHYELSVNIPEHEDEHHKRYIGASCTDCHGADDCDVCHGG